MGLADQTVMREQAVEVPFAGDEMAGLEALAARLAQEAREALAAQTQSRSVRSCLTKQRRPAVMTASRVARRDFAGRLRSAGAVHAMSNLDGEYCSVVTTDLVSSAVPGLHPDARNDLDHAPPCEAPSYCVRWMNFNRHLYQNYATPQPTTRNGRNLRPSSYGS
jgi:hypothetical protein